MINILLGTCLLSGSCNMTDQRLHICWAPAPHACAQDQARSVCQSTWAALLPRMLIAGTEAADLKHSHSVSFCNNCSCVRRNKPGLREYLGSALPRMLAAGMEVDDLEHVHQASYEIKCNWKVFNDNCAPRLHPTACRHEQRALLTGSAAGQAHLCLGSWVCA